MKSDVCKISPSYSEEYIQQSQFFTIIIPKRDIICVNIITNKEGILLEYKSVKKWPNTEEYLIGASTYFDSKESSMVLYKKGRSYLIPASTIKPMDKRYAKNKNISPLYQPIFAKIDELKTTLS